MALFCKKAVCMCSFMEVENFILWFIAVKDPIYLYMVKRLNILKK